MSKKTKQQNSTAKSATISIVIALSFIVLGIMTIATPENTGLALCYATGAALSVYGLFHSVSFLVDMRNDNSNSKYADIVLGIISLAFGIFILIKPDVIRDFVPIIIGIAIIVDSVLDIKNAFVLRALKMPKWWIRMLTSIAVILIALVAIFFNFLGTIIMYVLGAFLIFGGISSITDMVLIAIYGKNSRRYSKELGYVEAEATDVDEEDE